MMNGKHIILVLAALLCMAANAGSGSRPAAGEYEVKAAFLYNIMKFVEWPADSPASQTAVLNLCILGDDPFGPIIDGLAGRAVKNKAIVVRRIHTIAQLRDCQVLFISSSERAHLKNVLEAAKTGHILTVADTADFVGRGVVVNFSLRDRKVRFAINARAAERSGLKISSQLLKLADIVP